MPQRSHLEIVESYTSATDSLPDGARYLALDDLGRGGEDPTAPTMLGELAIALQRAVADARTPGLAPKARVKLEITVSEQGDNLAIVHKVTYVSPPFAQRTTHAIATRRWLAVQGELPLDGGLPLERATGAGGDDAKPRSAPKSPRRRNGAADDVDASAAT